MVEQRGARYVSNSEGAPPLPPPGGYRGARRGQTPAAPPAGARVDLAAPTPDADRRSADALGWVALVGAILFAIVLLGTLLAGRTDTLYGVTLLVLQLVVVAVVVAALLSRRGRMLGAVALVITLLLNVGTVGAMSALQTSASGNYEGVKSEAQKHAEAYPGVKDVPSGTILAQPSLEEVRSASEAVLADIRTALTEEFGYTWVQSASEDLRPERNGYGGESMLVQYYSTEWATVEPVQDHARKLDVMEAIDEVIWEHGLWGLISLNDPASGFDPTMLEKLYGSAETRTQHTWEWYSDNYPEPLRFYATINDLSHDRSGEFRASREAQSARTGEPVEGLQIFLTAQRLLSDADRAEFEQRMREYPGY